jgi:hypothetical protein
MQIHLVPGRHKIISAKQHTKAPTETTAAMVLLLRAAVLLAEANNEIARPHQQQFLVSKMVSHRPKEINQETTLPTLLVQTLTMDHLA